MRDQSSTQSANTGVHQRQSFRFFSASTSTRFLSLPHTNHRVAALKVVSLVQTDTRILKVPPFLCALNILVSLISSLIGTFSNTLGKQSHELHTYQDNTLSLANSLRCIPSGVQVQFPHISTSSQVPSLLCTGYWCSDVASTDFV